MRNNPILLGLLLALCPFGRPAIAQNRDNLTIDLPMLGAINKAGFSMGFSFRNVVKNTVGAFVMVHGSNPETYTILSGGDSYYFQSAFGQTTTFDTTYESYKPYGFSYGLSFNLSKLLKKDNLGLSLLISLSPVTESKGMRVSSITFYNNPYLPAKSGFHVDITKKRTLAKDFILNYDFIRSESFLTCSALCGINTKLGLLMAASVGFRFNR